jgi:hypothetical protein
MVETPLLDEVMRGVLAVSNINNSISFEVQPIA